VPDSAYRKPQGGTRLPIRFAARGKGMIRERINKPVVHRQRSGRARNQRRRGIGLTYDPTSNADSQKKDCRGEGDYLLCQKSSGEDPKRVVRGRKWLRRKKGQSRASCVIAFSLFARLSGEETARTTILTWGGKLWGRVGGAHPRGREVRSCGGFILEGGGGNMGLLEQRG